MISRRLVAALFLVVVFIEAVVAQVALETTRLHVPVAVNTTILSQWSITNSNASDSLSSISLKLSDAAVGDALFCPGLLGPLTCAGAGTSLEMNSTTATLEQFNTALQSVVFQAASVGTPDRSLNVTVITQSGLSVSEVATVWVHPLLRLDAPPLQFPVRNLKAFLFPDLTVDYYPDRALNATVSLHNGQTSDRVGTATNLTSASACFNAPSATLQLSSLTAPSLQAVLRQLTFDSCFGAGPARTVNVSVYPAEQPGDSSEAARQVIVADIVPEFAAFRNGSEVVQYPVVVAVGDIGPNAPVGVSLEYFLDHPGNVFCVAKAHTPDTKIDIPRVQDLHNMAFAPGTYQPITVFNSYGYGGLGATNATVRMTMGIKLGVDYVTFCVTAYDFFSLRGLSLNVTERSAKVAAARQSNDGSWTQTIIIVVCVVAGVICVERCYTSCRRVYRRRMGTEGFSEMPMVDSAAMDDDMDLSREVELAEREDRRRGEGRSMADPDAWKTGNTFVAV